MYKHKTDEQETRSEAKEIAEKVEDLKLEVETLRTTVLNQKEELAKYENETKLKLQELEIQVKELNEINEKKDKLIKSLREKLKKGEQQEKEKNKKLSENEIIKRKEISPKENKQPLKAKCDKCGKSFNGPNVLKVHIELHHEESSEKTRRKVGTEKNERFQKEKVSSNECFNCEKCGKEITEQRVLEAHMELHH